MQVVLLTSLLRRRSHTRSRTRTLGTFLSEPLSSGPSAYKTQVTRHFSAVYFIATFSSRRHFSACLFIVVFFSAGIVCYSMYMSAWFTFSFV